MKILFALLLLPTLASAADEWTTDNPNDLKGGFEEFSHWENGVDDACRPGRLGTSHALADSLLPGYSIDAIAESQKKEAASQTLVSHLDLVNLDYAHVANDSFQYRHQCAHGDATAYVKTPELFDRLTRDWSEYDGNHAKLVEELERMRDLVKSPPDYNRYDKACEGALNRALLGVKAFYRKATENRSAECNPAK